MLKSILSLVALSVSLSAHAVPSQYTHQGRLLDVDGVPVEDSLEITFRMMDSESGGSALWEDTLTLTLENGFFNAVLGADEEDNPLDTEVLNQAPLWLEVQVAGEDAMAPRSAVLSVPYAAIAGEAEALDGGPVDATEISVGGMLVIDEDGLWVGTPPVIDWVDLTGIPADLADGDDDNQLSEAEVENYVTNDALDLAAGTTLAGDNISTGSHTSALGWDAISGIPADIADGDDRVLTEAEVEDYVTNDSLALASGSTVGGEPISTGSHSDDTDTLGDLSCEVGDVAQWDGAAWACVSGVNPPSGTIAFFTTSCPSGWTDLSSIFGGRALVLAHDGGEAGESALVGEALGELGSRQITEVPTHGHGISAEGATTTSNGDHSHSYTNNHGGTTDRYFVTLEGAREVGGSSSATSTAGAHTHTLDLSSVSIESAGVTSVDVTMPYVQLRACQVP